MKIIEQFLFLFLFLFLSVLLVIPTYAKELMYSTPDNLNHRHDYIISLLNKAVEITNDKYSILNVVPFNKTSDSVNRRVRLVESGDTDVVWAATNSELERKLIPIRIPLHKGVYGFRIFLINKGNQAWFDIVENLKDLKFGCMHDSSDAKILQASGLKVSKVSRYMSLFKMLQKRRFDALPRGISEIFMEMEQFSKKFPNMRIENNLVLYYNKPVYFFFKDKKLARRIEIGLERMIRNGSFNELFDNQYRANLSKANLSERKIIRIDNHLLDEKTLPLSRNELWYQVIKGMAQYGVVLNLSGKQRMLTQKMSKELFLIALGVNVKDNFKNIEVTANLFDKTLTSLRDGSKEFGLPPTKNPHLIEELDKVRVLWTPCKKNIDTILKTNKITKEQIKVIAKLNIFLLNQMNKCVFLFEKEAGKGGITTDPYLATAINLSGRQRMLSQKMTKEFLLIALGHQVSDNQVFLRKTCSLFIHTLKGLLDGDEILHLKRTEQPVIRKQLIKVTKLWDNFVPILEQAIKASKPAIPLKQVKKIANMNLLLLRETNTVVEMYESESEGSHRK